MSLEAGITLLVWAWAFFVCVCLVDVLTDDDPLESLLWIFAGALPFWIFDIPFWEPVWQEILEPLLMKIVAPILALVLLIFWLKSDNFSDFRGKTVRRLAREQISAAEENAMQARQRNSRLYTEATQARSEARTLRRQYSDQSSQVEQLQHQVSTLESYKGIKVSNGPKVSNPQGRIDNLAEFAKVNDAAPDPADA